eukprot:14373-Eustigmatos_ZCMA.PRE.1
MGIDPQRRPWCSSCGHPFPDSRTCGAQTCGAANATGAYSLCQASAPSHTPCACGGQHTAAAANGFNNGWRTGQPGYTSAAAARALRSNSTEGASEPGAT